MASTSSRPKTGLAGSVGAANAHWQVRDRTSQDVLHEWRVPTDGHESLADVGIQGYLHAHELGYAPGFIGVGYSGPVDPTTGAATLTNVPKFQGQIVKPSELSSATGVPVVHSNATAAAARLLGRTDELSILNLTSNPISDTENYTLVEIGASLGAALFTRHSDVPFGAVLPSLTQHIAARVGTETTYETRLCGARGFAEQIQLVMREYIATTPHEFAGIPDDELGPAVTAYMADQPNGLYTQHFAVSYATNLASYLRLVQLAHQSTAIFIGGGVGRVPGFLERVLELDTFWRVFIGDHTGTDVLRAERQRMAIARINNTDLTVHGVYDTTIHHLARR